MGQYAHIGLLNVIRNLSYLGLEDYARMDQWNWISAHPVYQSVDAEAGTLFMATSSRLGSRCYLDCSGTISIRHYGFVGGHGCMLHTHTADYSCDMQTIGRITVGHHSMVCSRAVVLCGSFIPERSLVAANSTFTPRSSRDRKPGLYAGNPAVWKRDTPGSGWFVRRTYSTHGHGIKGPMGILPDDRTPPEFCGPPTDVGVNNGKLVVLEDLT
jgi:acetyltransferase-like isoleucine patch superfamily enzyme